MWVLNGDYFTYGNQKLREELGHTISKFEEVLVQTFAYYDQLDWPVSPYGMTEAWDRDQIDCFTVVVELVVV